MPLSLSGDLASCLDPSISASAAALLALRCMRVHVCARMYKYPPPPPRLGKGRPVFVKPSQMMMPWTIRAHKELRDVIMDAAVSAVLLAAERVARMGCAVDVRSVPHGRSTSASGAERGATLAPATSSQPPLPPLPPLPTEIVCYMLGFLRCAELGDRTPPPSPSPSVPPLGAQLFAELGGRAPPPSAESSGGEGAGRSRGNTLSGVDCGVGGAIGGGSECTGGARGGSRCADERSEPCDL